MNFHSAEFIVFFIITYVLLLVFREKAARQVILMLSSLFFYAWWDFRFLFLLLFEVQIVYVGAVCIERAESKVTQKRYLALSVTICLVILGFFKYFNFFLNSFGRLFHISATRSLDIILPIGISFYTFQAISYIVDVYRKEVSARYKFREVCLYIVFFPQLVAGPIVRSKDFLPQLDKNIDITYDNFEKGIQIFLFGLAKKVVVADRLAVCVDSVFASPTAYSGMSVLFAVISYSLQIYCDFSGYSDMAIGLARILGYTLPMNFNMSYISKNPSEFWKRWHISLSQWIQDYIYIPLGGNRKGRARTYINLFVTMLLCGLWHGANWTFVIWGVYHGIALVIHKVFRTVNGKWLQRKPEYSSSGRGIQDNVFGGVFCILNFIFVAIGWVIFRCSTIEDAWTVLCQIFFWKSGINYVFVYTLVYGAIIAICYIIAQRRDRNKGFYPLLNLRKFSSQVALGIILWLFLVFAYMGDTAFIYFQF